MWPDAARRNSPWGLFTFSFCAGDRQFPNSWIHLPQLKQLLICLLNFKVTHTKMEKCKQGVSHPLHTDPTFPSLFCIWVVLLNLHLMLNLHLRSFCKVTFGLAPNVNNYPAPMSPMSSHHSSYPLLCNLHRHWSQIKRQHQNLSHLFCTLLSAHFGSAGGGCLSHFISTLPFFLICAPAYQTIT